MGVRFRKESSSVDSWTIADLGGFYSEHRYQLRSHAYRFLKDLTRAEEVVQESILRVLLAAPELKSRDQALSYMHRTIRNLCIDEFRLAGHQPHLVLIDDASAEVEIATLSEATAEEILIAAEDAAIVREALSLLSPAERTALVLWEVEGRSSSEIAQQLGIKESSVRHTVSRARASLRKVLSQFVIDEAKGLTALDLLSKSYKKTATLAKASQKIAFSMAIVIFAFVGFNSFYGPSLSTAPTPAQNSFQDTKDSDVNSTQSLIPNQSQVLPKEVLIEKGNFLATKTSPRKAERKIKALNFPGLDKSGIPFGFSISDNSGALGDAYFLERSLVTNDGDVATGQVIKTTSGAPNIFLSQSLRTDSEGFSYNPILSFGQSGMWVPLQIKVVSTEIERSLNGNYLITAYIAVESVIETPIKIAAKANGRDLLEAPERVITRFVLDSSKTQVLSQAVYVVENGVGA